MYVYVLYICIICIYICIIYININYYHIYQYVISKAGQVPLQDFGQINWPRLRKNQYNYDNSIFLDSVRLIIVWKK